MQSDFEESIVDIAGLKDYQPHILPPWFRAILLECSSEEAPESMSDCDLVARHVAAYGVPWLNAWGTANVAGQTVFVCQSDGLTEPICLAADVECGFMLVEPSELDDIGYTIFFVEKFRG
jgi:hypothetical protein